MIYLCAAGTSAAKLWSGSGVTGYWFGRFVEETNVSIEEGASILFDTIKDFRMDSETDLGKNLSAEIHSLARMGLSSLDDVVLFASETPDGQMCARAVTQYLESNGFQVHVKVIEGLQVHDSLKFRRMGVVNYIRQALKL